MIYIGICGWNTQGLYEPGIRTRDKLAIYSSIYNTVEVNTTFYQIPRPATVESWYHTVPDDFRFSIKIYRLFSHDARLALNTDMVRRLEAFVENTSLLKEKLSWYLLQLPPSFTADLVLLSGFLNKMRQLMEARGMNVPIAVEFRHASWYGEEALEILRRYDAVQVISSSPSLWPCVWQVQGKADYLRLHGLKKIYHSSYEKEELDKLYQWLLESSAAPDSWIYFDNTVTTGARENSQYLMRRFGQTVPEQATQLSMDLDSMSL